MIVRAQTVSIVFDRNSYCSETLAIAVNVRARCLQSAIATVKGRSACRATTRASASASQISRAPGATSARKGCTISRYAKVHATTVRASRVCIFKLFLSAFRRVQLQPVRRSLYVCRMRVAATGRTVPVQTQGPRQDMRRVPGTLLELTAHESGRLSRYVSGRANRGSRFRGVCHNINNARACAFPSECDCFMPGVLSGVGVCNTKTGQCVCKPSATSRRCDECAEGFYSLNENSLFGCTGTSQGIIVIIRPKLLTPLTPLTKTKCPSRRVRLQRRRIGEREMRQEQRPVFLST